jgi:hypothetical protein
MDSVAAAGAARLIWPWTQRIPPKACRKQYLPPARNLVNDAQPPASRDAGGYPLDWETAKEFALARGMPPCEARRLTSPQLRERIALLRVLEFTLNRPQTGR